MMRPELARISLRYELLVFLCRCNGNLGANHPFTRVEIHSELLCKFIKYLVNDCRSLLRFYGLDSHPLRRLSSGSVLFLLLSC